MFKIISPYPYDGFFVYQKTDVIYNYELAFRLKNAIYF